MSRDSKQHWEYIYGNKSSHELSWTQEVPSTSLNFIHSFKLSKSARIIDIGGGESPLVDFLLKEGFENVTVLDISANALEKAKQRLGNKADQVRWIQSDITEFEPDSDYEVWHDRATFHFLTTREQIDKYLSVARKSVKGYLAMGTFSNNGPTNCSGLDVRQYTEDSLSSQLQHGFRKIRCVTEDHVTPFQTRQNFLFCSFRKV